MSVAFFFFANGLSVALVSFASGFAALDSIQFVVRSLVQLLQIADDKLVQLADDRLARYKLGGHLIPCVQIEHDGLATWIAHGLPFA